MTPKERAQRVIEMLEPEYGLHGTELAWGEDPWRLLVAVSLSAQTTDANVNSVTPELFKAYPTPEAMRDAPQQRLEKLIYSTGYYRAKARNLKRMASAIANEHGGRVPETMEELVKLPGVGRKTANVVLQVWKNERHGIVMDTHIQRVTMRLGFIPRKDAKLGEETMMAILPKEQWLEWGDLLIQHGRRTCQAKKPACDRCPLNELCPSAFSFEHFEPGADTSNQR